MQTRRAGELDEDKIMQIATPRFRFEWNLNTIVVLLGFAAGLIGWGYTFNDIQVGRTQNKENIGRLDARLATVETEIRRIDNHELRITSIEKSAADAANTMRSLDKSINDLSSDMRVVREILQRIEAQQKARFQP
jgi:hypothetical protein